MLGQPCEFYLFDETGDRGAATLAGEHERRAEADGDRRAVLELGAIPGPRRPRRVPVEPRLRRRAADSLHHLGFGRTVALEAEVPNMLVHMV